MRVPEHACPNHNNVRVSRAYDYQSIHAPYDYQSIHAQTIITFVFREHTITRTARLPRGSCLQSRLQPRALRRCAQGQPLAFGLRQKIWQFLHCFPHLPKLEITGKASRSCARAHLRAREQVPGAFLYRYVRLCIVETLTLNP